MINSIIDTTSEMFVTVSGFSGSRTAVIHHGWHLLLHINAPKFHRFPHSDWCSRLSPYLARHSPAEYQMNGRSFSQTRCDAELYQWMVSPHCALMTGSDKPVYTLSLKALFFSHCGPFSIEPQQQQCVCLLHCSAAESQRSLSPLHRTRHFVSPAVYQFSQSA